MRLVTFLLLLLAVAQLPNLRGQEHAKTDIDNKELASFSDAEQAYIRFLLTNDFVIPVRDFRDVKKGDVCIITHENVGFHIDQIISPSEVLIFGNNIWLEGVDTSTITEGTTVHLPNLALYLAGNKQYRTVVGSTKSPRHYIVAGTDKANNFLAAHVKKNDLQMIRDRTGNLVAVGTVLRVTKTSVQIKPKVGKPIGFAINSIFEADRLQIEAGKARK